ncbi:MAG: TIGR02452 family protein, partial [Lachnospiraceae bacterium]|nr:TIGR02452 family protein [Lachnospiraceae bacterium]
MKKADLRTIAQDTLKVIEDGYYVKNGRKIELINTDAAYDFGGVEVYDERRCAGVMKEAPDFFAQNFWGFMNCRFFLMDADSLEAAAGMEAPLVMNFANAVTPGGGFLNGAQAQEECLCRNSTLYASISSGRADEMYHYNREHPSATGSDYMLLSPEVCVFRKPTLEYLDEPYEVAVMTVPAPNRNGRAVFTPQRTLDIVMKDRLRKFLTIAARNGYRSLVLGAWGCGAFGHNTDTVAGYFYDLFFIEGYHKYFEEIVFAIWRDEEKMAAFRKVFGNKLIDYSSGADFTMRTIADDYPNFYEAMKAMPACNHTRFITGANIGYTQVILKDGMPIEAELWRQDELDLMLAVIMPQKKIIIPKVDDYGEEEEEVLRDGGLIGARKESKQLGKGILTLGMDVRDVAVSQGEKQMMMRYLEFSGIIKFTTAKKDIGMVYLKDLEGNDVVRIHVMLKQDGVTLA